MKLNILLPVALFAAGSLADPADTLQDNDDLNTGYLSQHTVDPTALSLLWSSQPLNPSEVFIAKPLFYTPPKSKTGLLIAASAQNNIYILNSRTGAVVQKRKLRDPYLEPTLPCGDGNDFVNGLGIIGTPTIDRNTGTLYAFAKGYNTTARGPFNSGYHLHAVDVVTLKERPGFPVLLQGAAVNDPTRYFNGGLYLQRPALKLKDGILYAGFGGGCGAFNQTGWLASIHVGTRATRLWATQTGPEAPKVDPTAPLPSTGGGGGSIWQAGSGFTSDRRNRMFLTVGNGALFNASQPAMKGRSPPPLLEGTLLALHLKGDGAFSVQDHFRPWNYTVMGGNDRDMGAAAVTLLPPASFPAGKKGGALAVVGGKNGILYLLNPDNLGGYQQGVNGTDAVYQSWAVPGVTRGLIYGGIGVYPLKRGGGYIYIKPVGLTSILAYRFAPAKDGTPRFIPAGTSSQSFNTPVGTGPPVVTANGILWVVDIKAGLTAYKAVPENGKLIQIPLPLSGRSKFQRPVFGGGGVYTVTTDGRILAFAEKKGVGGLGYV